jgi:competence protein ComEA
LLPSCSLSAPGPHRHGAQAPAKPEQKAPPAAKKQPLDINSASADELKTVAGISEADAKKIIENRPYKSKDDLVQKKVMPKATYDKIKDQIVAK